MPVGLRLNARRALPLFARGLLGAPVAARVNAGQDRLRDRPRRRIAVGGLLVGPERQLDRAVRSARPGGRCTSTRRRPSVT
jgi:hypothetical protein